MESKERLMVFLLCVCMSPLFIVGCESMTAKPEDLRPVALTDETTIDTSEMKEKEITVLGNDINPVTKNNTGIRLDTTYAVNGNHECSKSEDKVIYSKWDNSFPDKCTYTISLENDSTDDGTVIIRLDQGS
jgi:hypothetical protein